MAVVGKVSKQLSNPNFYSESNFGRYFFIPGLKLDEVTKIVPPELDIACHNSLQNYTLSGPESVLEPFIQSLQKKGVYARSFKSFHVAAHSRYLQDIGPMFLEFAKSVCRYLFLECRA